MITIPVRLTTYTGCLARAPESFHKVSDILSLLPSGIDVNPKSVEADELVEHAWKVMEPYYHDSIDKICDAYHQAKSKGTGSDNMNEIAGSSSRKGRNPLIEAALQIQVK
jgi:hypothetical protein